jgi:hypothetical protein
MHTGEYSSCERISRHVPCKTDFAPTIPGSGVHSRFDIRSKARLEDTILNGFDGVKGTKGATRRTVTIGRYQTQHVAIGSTDVIS